MKLLRVKAKHFKNCADDFMIDFMPRDAKTPEDKEYELQEIAPDLYSFNTVAFIGKNASGKTTAIELLDCCYSILGDFRLTDKYYSLDGVELEIIFFHDNYLYWYETTLTSGQTMNNQVCFNNEHIYQKKYYKSRIKEIYDKASYKEMTGLGALPEDTAKIFFVSKKKQTMAVFFDAYKGGSDTYQILFKALKNYNIELDVLSKITGIFDESIQEITRIDDNNYHVITESDDRIMSDAQLVYFLSSGTTKGLLLYTLMVASLKNGFDLLIDEIENHFHKTLVENMIGLYRDKAVNKKNASLIFTTHYCEILDLMGRQDNIWICSANSHVKLSNMSRDYSVEASSLKSRQYYDNAFQTAVNYEKLMGLKKVLKQ